MVCSVLIVCLTNANGYLLRLCVQSRTPALIFEYVNNTDFKVYVAMFCHIIVM